MGGDPEHLGESDQSTAGPVRRCVGHDGQSRGHVGARGEANHHHPADQQGRPRRRDDQQRADDEDHQIEGEHPGSPEPVAQPPTGQRPDGATRRRTQVRSGRSGQSTEGLLAATSEPNAQARSEIGDVGPAEVMGLVAEPHGTSVPRACSNLTRTRATGPSGMALSVSSARLSVAGERYPVGPGGRPRHRSRRGAESPAENPQPTHRGRRANGP